MAVFRVGQRVVCVDAAYADGSIVPRAKWPLREGAVYTVAGFSWSKSAQLETLQLVGVPAPAKTGWQKRRFRPAVDIEQFRTLVEPAALRQLRSKLEPVG